MKLTQATILNYKTIASETNLDVDGRITALLGKSEAGKTNVLEAINSVFTEQPYSDDQRCSWGERPRAEDIVVWLTLTLETDDAEMLDPTGSVLAAGQIVRVGRRRNGELVSETDAGMRLESQMSDDLRRMLSRLRSRCRSIPRALAELAPRYGWPPETGKNIDQLADSLVSVLRPRESQEDEGMALDEAQQIATAMREEMVTLRKELGVPELEGLQRRATWLLKDVKESKKKNAWEAVSLPPFDIDVLEAALPYVQYVPSAEKAYITDREAVTQLKEKPQEYPLHVNLLKLGGLTASDLTINNPTDLHRRLYRAEQQSSAALSQVWSQEPVEVHLNVTEDKLGIELRGPEGHYGRPGQRSEGFLWFLSFYLRYLAPATREGKEPRHRILLLDEPGLHLHASAQQDLLKLLEDAAHTTQIIYTTHSPFMVNKNYPYRIREVRKGNETEGTRINNTPYHSRQGLAWEPVRTAIGVTAGNSLFIAGQNLVVEGISDQILLAALSQRLTRKSGKVGLDLDAVAISPADGAQSAVPLAHFCASSCENTVVLLDADDEGEKAKKRLMKAKVFPENKILTVADAADAKTMEDLVDEALYHQAVIEAYGEVGGEPPAQDIPESREGVEEQLAGTSNDGAGSEEQRRSEWDNASTAALYGKFWKEKEWGNFGRALVARKLAQMSVEDNDSKAWEETVANFKKLFDAINERLGLEFKKPGDP